MGIGDLREQPVLKHVARRHDDHRRGRHPFDAGLVPLVDQLCHRVFDQAGPVMRPTGITIAQVDHQRQVAGLVGQRNPAGALKDVVQR